MLLSPAYPRAVRLSLHVLWALLLACIFRHLSGPMRHRIQQGWSRQLLDILHVKRVVQDQRSGDTPAASLLIANHISWLDIFAIQATLPARFVAKSEVQRWPLLGWLVAQTGTLFIQRSVLRDTARINQRIADLLRQGESVALFPQGTSTDCMQAVHFHSSLLQGAIDASACVQPLAVYYHDGQGHPLHALAFVGDMTFVQSLWRILCIPEIQVSLTLMAPLASDQMVRRSLASHAQVAINYTMANHLQTPLMLQCSLLKQ